MFLKTKVGDMWDRYHYQSCNGFGALPSPCINYKSSMNPIPVWTFPDKMTRMLCRYSSTLINYSFQRKRKGLGTNLSFRFLSSISVVLDNKPEPSFWKYHLVTELVKWPRKISFGDLQCRVYKLVYLSSLGNKLQSWHHLNGLGDQNVKL